MPSFPQCGALLGGAALLGLLGAWISASRHLSDVAPRS